MVQLSAIKHFLKLIFTLNHNYLNLVLKEFKVSVIVPVFNAAKYLQRAVDSAINLLEVGEVILVEDGSSDGSLDVCRALELRYSEVFLVQHKDGENKGAGASRNLGIKNSSFNYISFLDADDWYLPNRFQKDFEIFAKLETADGVYGATGFYHENKSQLDLESLTTLRSRISPDQLIYNLLDGNGGHFTTDAVTLKREFLERIGCFDEGMKLHQDTHLWIRCALQGNIYAGQIDRAIAVRRVHSGNRITQQTFFSNRLLYEKIFHSLLMIKVNNNVFKIAFKRYIGTKTSNKFYWYPLATFEMIKRPRILLKMYF